MPCSKILDTAKWADYFQACAIVVLIYYTSSASFLVIAQRPQYDISIRLDTASHTLAGTIDIMYTNRSIRPMDSIGMHLYPNAYTDNSSALVKQLLRQGQTELFFATNDQRGEISGMTWATDIGQVDLQFDILHRDMAWLVLQNSLLPGQSITLSSPFVVRIPESFSRMGRTGDGYQLTQWYPHVAVHDDQGWHMMPYLDIGEFFNDFADYKVSIQVPPGYTIAATGHMTNCIKNDTETIWKWEAEHVIDFAWFASPHFEVETREVWLSSGKRVQLEVYADTTSSHLWNHVPRYAERALQFYSDWVGAYPYDYMRIVSTPMSNAGFMEYPMIAQISHTADSIFMDEAVAHEIGHTWLYGVLANDERTHPWLDEGLNTFVERKYMEQYHPGHQETLIGRGLSADGSMSLTDAWQHSLQFQRLLDPPGTDPQMQHGDQYGFSAYTLPAQGLELMQRQVGTDMIKSMFNIYFEDHKFTHVAPEDMKSSFESICDCDLSWFFEDWIRNAHQIDYRIARLDKINKDVVLINRGADGIPLHLSAYSEGQLVEQHWIDGFRESKTIRLRQDADEVRLYDQLEGVNGSWNRSVYPRTAWPHFTFLPKLSSYSRPLVHVSPFIALNITDGVMPGIVLSSGLAPQRHFKWLAAPLFGIESGKVRGYAEGRYAGDFSKGLVDKWLLSLSASYFGYNEDTSYHVHEEFLRICPSLGVRVAPRKDFPHLSQWWKYRYVHVMQEFVRGIDVEAGTFELLDRSYGVHEISYKRQSDFVLQPYTATVNIQAGQGFVKLNVHYRQHFMGKDKRRGIWIHGFGGWLPQYDNPKANVKFDFSGSASYEFFSKDYMYDYWLGGRNATTGLFSRQLFQKDAGLKTLAVHGVSEQWMAGAGFSIAFPFPYIHFYMDGAAYHGYYGKTELSYSGGLSLVLLKDVFEVYVPVLESRDILDGITYTQRDRWFERVSFQANIKLANPIDLLDSWQLRY